MGGFVFVIFFFTYNGCHFTGLSNFNIHLITGLLNQIAGSQPQSFWLRCGVTLLICSFNRLPEDALSLGTHFRITICLGHLGLNSLEDPGLRKVGKN